MSRSACAARRSASRTRESRSPIAVSTATASPSSRRSRSACRQPPPGRELHTANDMAAVLDWRLPEPAPTDPGPLPWLPGIPSTLHDPHVWGEYLAKRSQLVVGLANQVRDCASQKSEQPVWAPPGSHPSVALIAEIAVWRAAVGVDPQDRRPTGAGQLQAASALWQQNLDRDVALCSHRVGADVRKRQVGGPSQDHQREDRHRMPPARDVRRSVPPGPRV